MLSFHVKFVQTDRQTAVKQYAPDLSKRGHKNQTFLFLLRVENIVTNIFSFSHNLFKCHLFQGRYNLDL